jgi:phosphoglycerol transferase MdoB-like AlkP superfamily enzyme
MKRVGFEKVLNKEIMKNGDRKYKWGYDDCTFYTRSFDYLEENHSPEKPLLVFFEVSVHHSPWEGYEEYKFTHKFDKPSNFMERYLNSALQQDYCISVFYEKFKKSSFATDTHLFIMSDTSQPVGLHGSVHLKQNAFNENYLTPFAYIPPKNSENQYQVGKEVRNLYSQTDVIPTIFELLEGNAFQNSFASVLRKQEGTSESPYEECHVLTQPYGGGQIAVAKEDWKYVYFVADKKVEIWDMDDLLELDEPFNVLENISYEDFFDEYYCERFK